MKKLIVGAGGDGKGGGGSAHTPVEDRDSLQSRAFARVIDLISEGEISGLVDGHKSIYLDGTPLQNTDGQNNFSGVKVSTRRGTQNQSYIPEFPAAENEVAVSVVVTKATPITRTFTDETIDAIGVRVSFPQMTEQDDETGDLHGSVVHFRIYLQSNGGGFEEVVDDTVRGKCVSKYERAYRIDLEGDGPWDIKIERVSNDSDSVLVQNRMFWESYKEIIDGKLRYPNSAIAAVTIDAKQFSSIPTRGYDVKLLKIRIPSNATVDSDTGALTYIGDWDGTFQTAWSSNPAWVFYDILVESRYGLGAFIDSDLIDKWTLYTIGQYCDELVDDGEGGTEPRFSCNAYLQVRAEAYRVLQDLASIFRGICYWSGGTITFAQDAPSDSAHLFTPSNVVDGLFTYSGSSAKSRHTVALVGWNDPEDLYRQKVEYVEDQDGISRYGVIETQVTAFGCTSRGQAHRVGKWLLYSERYQTETVTFKTGLNGATCRPGEVIQIADPVRAGSRRGGRVVSAEVDSMVIDYSLTIEPSSHTLSALLPDGTVETVRISSALDRNITFMDAFTQAPNPNSVWMVQSTAVDAQYFKIISISENKDGTHDITALAHNPDKYDAIENDLALEPRSISALTLTPDQPTNIQLVETLYEVNGEVRVKLTISWGLVENVNAYVVQYQRDDQNINDMGTSTNDVEILNVEPGLYSISIYAVNTIGVRSIPGTTTKQVIGKARPPGMVQGFSLIPMGNTAYLSWEKSTDLDVLIGGSVRLRHTPDTVAVSWKNSVDITPALAGSATRATVPLLSGSYVAKFVDSSGNASDDWAEISTEVPDGWARNVVETLTEDPTFSGDKTNMEYAPSLTALALSPGHLIDDVLDNVDDLPNWDFAGGVQSSGSYDFFNTIDLLGTYTCRVTARIKADAIDIADTIDLRTSLVDDWIDLDGEFIDDVNAELYMRTTTDDPSGSPTWTVWKRFFVGEYAFRAAEFQLRATSDDPDHNIAISELEVVVDMPDRTFEMNGLISGAGTYSLAFTEPFAAVPSVAIMAHNLNTGDYPVIASKTRSGFDITFRNSSGTAVSRTFDMIAKGYGREQ
jgi:predicted phage tail protein